MCEWMHFHSHIFFIFLGGKPLLMLQKVLIAVAIFFTSFASAQNHRHALTLSSGLAFPLGKFAEKDIRNSSSGFAKTGTLLNAGYTRPVTKTIWVEAVLQYQQNPLNTKAMEESLSTTRFRYGVFVSPNPQNPGAFPDTLFQNWKVNNDSWVTATLLLGINSRYSLGSSNKVFAQAKLQLGPVYVSSPEIDGTSTGASGATYLKQTDASGWGLAVGAGGGIEYNLNERLFTLINVQSFFTSSIKFKDIKATLTMVNGASPNPTSVMESTVTGDAKQNISTININFGLGLRL